MTVTQTRRRSLFRTRKARILLTILALLIALRIALPYIVLHFANKTLAGMNGYYGHIEDIDISLYRGAYGINDMYLHKKDTITGKQSDFFNVRNIDLSIEWRAILHGRIVGELEFTDPRLIFTKDKVELGEVKKDTNDFRKILKSFMPLKVNRFEVKQGSLHYTDNTSSPHVDVALKQIHILARNLTNAADSSQLLPSTVAAQAKAYEGGLQMNMKLNPLASQSTFDLNVEIKNVNLVLLNDFIKAYGNFDVNRGNFGLYSEMAAKEGRFKGYVKPIIKDLDVVGPADKKDGFFRKIYEHLVGAAGVVFRNQKKDQVASKLTLEGSFEDPDADVWNAVWEVLRNAFIQALMPSVDNQININAIDTEKAGDDRTLFQKILGTGKKKD